MEQISQALCAAADRCPGRELECSVVTVAQAGRLRRRGRLCCMSRPVRGKPGRTVYPGGDPPQILTC